MSLNLPNTNKTKNKNGWTHTFPCPVVDPRISPAALGDSQLIHLECGHPNQEAANMRAALQRLSEEHGRLLAPSHMHRAVGSRLLVECKYFED